MSKTSHTITCSDEYCLAYSFRGFFQGVATEERIRKHRADNVADGWTDHEGRDYCPDHNPMVNAAS